MKTYVYANSQILAQHNGNYNAPRFFYLHDRLGSVRLVINSAIHLEKCLPPSVMRRPLIRSNLRGSSTILRRVSITLGRGCMTLL
jgi:hypothetical protein